MQLSLSRPVNEESRIALVRWHVMKADELELHFVGFHAETGVARVSSAIVELDTVRYRGTTWSGREYEFAGPAGSTSDVAEPWLAWATYHGLTTSVDMTEQLFPDTGTGAYH